MWVKGNNLRKSLKLGKTLPLTALFKDKVFLNLRFFYATGPCCPSGNNGYSVLMIRTFAVRNSHSALKMQTLMPIHAQSLIRNNSMASPSFLQMENRFSPVMSLKYTMKFSSP